MPHEKSSDNGRLGHPRRNWSDDGWFGPGHWPPRTDWLAKPSRKRSHPKQLRSIEREQNREPEPPPSQQPEIWRRIFSTKCRSCGHRGGIERLWYWRHGFHTYRCKYCLHWRQVGLGSSGD